MSKTTNYIAIRPYTKSIEEWMEEMVMCFACYLLFPAYIKSELSEAIPTKRLVIDDRIIKLNDYLLIYAVTLKN